MRQPSLDEARWRALLPVGLAFLGAILFVGLRRETAYADDWAYAVMVRDLVADGCYRMHAWVAANPLLQIAWGALWSELFGFSFAVLRLSTLALAAIALAAFYHLCRAHRMGARESTLLTLALLGSPLFLRHAFTFMTDVPFIAATLSALLVYGRALARRSVGLMAAGSVLAAAAILIRQFGVAFLPALLFVWLSRAERARRAPAFLAATLLPLAATIWQLEQGARATAWTGRLRAVEQVAYLESPVFLFDLLWRSATTTIYLALFIAPVLLLALATDPLRRRTARIAETFGGSASLGFLGAVAFALGIGALAYDRPAAMPILEWNLEFVSRWPLPLRGALTLLLVAGATWWLGALVRRYRDPLLRPADDSERLLDATAGCLLLGQLVYYQFADRYLLPLVPFALVVAGRELWLRRPLDAAQLRAGVAVALLFTLAASVRARGTLERSEALWNASEWARTHGTPAERIHSESWEWEYYHGSFDRWLATFGDPAGADFDDYFDHWLPTTAARALVSVQDERSSNVAAAAVHRVPYRDALFRRRAVVVLAREPVPLPICSSGHVREADATGWWHWTARELACDFMARPGSAEALVVEFDSLVPRGPQAVEIFLGANRVPAVLLTGWHSYRSPPLAPGEDRLLVRIAKADDSPPQPLSPSDPRLASFLIKNLRVTEVPDASAARPEVAPHD